MTEGAAIRATDVSRTGTRRGWAGVLIGAVLAGVVITPAVYLLVILLRGVG